MKSVSKCSFEIVALYLVSLCAAFCVSVKGEKGTLKILQVISRHGARTPNAGSYPNDPNVVFLSQGYSQLTREGTIQMFEMGKIIQKRYSEFLTNDYRTVLARSSYKTRCIQTGQAILAAIYPNQIVIGRDSNNDLTKIIPPIPILVETPPCTNMLYPDKKEAVEIIGDHDLFIERILSKEFLRDIRMNVSLALALHNVTVDEMLNYEDVLASEKFHSLLLPPWYDSLYPNLRRMNSAFYREFSTHSTLAQLNAGELLNEIFLNLEKTTKTKDTNTEINTFFYFTHDLVISCLLGLLNVPLEDPPGFGATLLVEKHQLNATTTGVKFIYVDSPESEPISLQLPGCHSPNNYCTIQELKDKVKIF